MRYYKIVKDGYITGVGIGTGTGEEITQEEYATLLKIIKTHPIAEDGYEYRLTVNLEWEQFETPIIGEG